MSSKVLIIGGGQAGTMVAISLRQQKYIGPITIITQDNYMPYQKPPLSKGFLDGSVDERRLYFKSQDYYKKNNITLIKGCQVKNIAREQKIVTIDNDTNLKYGKLVLATGSLPKKLEHSSNEENISYLSSINDSLKIKSIIENKEKIAVIGSGYIGLEIAAIARKRGAKVTIIEMAETVMTRSLCYETSRFFQEKHEKEGVKFLFDSLVVNIKDHGNEKIITTNHNCNIKTDAIVIGIGIKPNIELAINSGIECDNGILVDENGQTSDKNIFAAGDCTNHPNNIYNRRFRLESVQNAIEQAKTVASTIIGKYKPYQKVPWFWSDQYNLKLQIAGISDSYDNYFLKGSLEKEKFAVFYLKNNKLIAVEAVNQAKAFINGKKIIGSKSIADLSLIETISESQ